MLYTRAERHAFYVCSRPHSCGIISHTNERTHNNAVYHVIHTVKLQQPELNILLETGFRQHADAPSVKRTHWFNDRYENIYLTRQHIPALADLLNIASEHARSLLPGHRIKSGCWFNAMPPGSVTTRHHHDDDDELLSAVYYLNVPGDSGDLILYDTEPPTRITPVAGQLILFPPDIDHEVTRNNSSQERLSIGINFGPAHED